MIQVATLLSSWVRELLQMVKLICITVVSFFQLGLRLKQFCLGLEEQASLFSTPSSGFFSLTLHSIPNILKGY